jgi:anti-repressor protein
MNAIRVFEFYRAPVRIIMVDNEPWWCAADVCNVLGYKNGRDAVGKHCRKEGVAKHDTPTSGGNQQIVYINEGNMFRLIAKSELPDAAIFEKWLFEEVLPQIRKTGSFSLHIPKTLPEALRAYASEVEAHERSKQLLIEQQPKVEAWQRFIDSEGLVDMNYVAQECGTGKNRLFKRLRDEKVFFQNGMYNSVYQEYVNRGYFQIKFVTNKDIGNIPVIKCTPKGAEWIYNKFYRKEAA